MSPVHVADDCVFCGIVAGRVPSSQLYSDDDVVAFLDIRPLTTGHLLVVPRKHASGLDALDERTGARLFAAAQRLARAVRGSGLPCDGVNLFLADGAAAGQEVFHLHLHVLPRTAGDGFTISTPRRHPDQADRPDRADLDAVAVMVRRSLTAITNSTRGSTARFSGKFALLSRYRPWEGTRVMRV
jgi:histidine triad (HIT) family protein